MSNFIATIIWVGLSYLKLIAILLVELSRSDEWD